MAATGRRYFGRGSYRFLTAGELESSSSDQAVYELDESDIWNSSVPLSPEFRRPVRSSRAVRNKKRGDRDRDPSVGEALSLPVNVPDWSKILKDEYRQNRILEKDEEEEEEVEEDEYGGDGENQKSRMIPPHEIVAQTRIASFSVEEGIGRTLKGRDLSRVRNAIWEKTGFQD